LKLQLKQWKDTLPSGLAVSPPRPRVSMLSPLCGQQGALKLVHPLGVVFFLTGKIDFMKSLTIFSIYYIIH
jgi:hypothetical protein